MKTFNVMTPIYLQIMDDLKKQICAGAIAPGEKLPSVREYALDQGVNPNTVQRALSQLEQENLVITNRTSGRFVTENRELIRKMKETMATVYVADFLDKMREIGYQKDDILDLMETIGKEVETDAIN